MEEQKAKEYVRRDKYQSHKGQECENEKGNREENSIRKSVQPQRNKDTERKLWSEEVSEWERGKVEERGNEYTWYPEVKADLNEYRQSKQKRKTVK